jgi:hypothetical protein
MRINARKIIQNLEVVNSFGLPISPTSVALVRAVTEKARKREMEEIRFLDFFFFLENSFLKSGPVHTP